MTLRTERGDETRWVRLGAPRVAIWSRSSAGLRAGDRVVVPTASAAAAAQRGADDGYRRTHRARPSCAPSSPHSSPSPRSPSGVLGLLATPREEEPQISVPMIDVIAAHARAPRRARRRTCSRGRSSSACSRCRAWTTSTPCRATATPWSPCASSVGEDQERSVTRVRAKLASAADRAPPGALPPRGEAALDRRRAGARAHAARAALRRRTSCARWPCTWRTRSAPCPTWPRPSWSAASRASCASRSTRRGWRRAASRRARWRWRCAAPTRVCRPASSTAADSVYRIDVGAPLTTAAEVGSVVVTARGGAPVYVRDVADVRDGFGEPTSYVSHAGARRAPPSGRSRSPSPSARARTPRSVTHEVLERVDAREGRLLPARRARSPSRATTARRRARRRSELILHLLDRHRCR